MMCYNDGMATFRERLVPVYDYDLSDTTVTLSAAQHESVQHSANPTEALDQYIEAHDDLNDETASVPPVVPEEATPEDAEYVPANVSRDPEQDAELATVVDESRAVDADISAVAVPTPDQVVAAEAPPADDNPDDVTIDEPVRSTPTGPSATDPGIAPDSASVQARSSADRDPDSEVPVEDDIPGDSPQAQPDATQPAPDQPQALSEDSQAAVDESNAPADEHRKNLVE